MILDLRKNLSDLCWPWFGAHPVDSEMPRHGFVREVSWQLASIKEADECSTELVLCLSDADPDCQGRFQPFRLELTVSVGSELKVALKSVNTGENTLSYTAGLHSYFNIGDISSVSVKGVDGHGCFNKESGGEEIQHGDSKFSGLTTRIYRKIQNATIEDPVLKRQIEISIEGVDSIVVWNPGSGVEKRFAGFSAGDERTMLCVEATNPVGYGITLEPGATHCLSTRILCRRA